MSQAGVADLTLAAGLMPSSTPTRALLGDPKAHYERYVVASPRERLPLGIPQLVLHGDRDETVSVASRPATRRPLVTPAIPVSFASSRNTGHYEHIDAGADAWHVAREWLVDQASALRS